MSTSRTPTAAFEAYATGAACIKGQIARLEALLEQHAKRAAADPLNWGFPGDLGCIESRLAALLESFGA